MFRLSDRAVSFPVWACGPEELALGGVITTPTLLEEGLEEGSGLGKIF